MIHQNHSQWLSQRGIKSDTAEQAGVQTVNQQGKNWLVFPYEHQGNLVNRKFRLSSEKVFQMDKGGKLVLWNNEVLKLKQVQDGEAPVIITEGEIDALTAMQCGFKGAVSVPNGAPSEKADDPLNAGRYSYLWESKSDLEAVKSFILATDGDKAGLALAHDLVSILGPERCKFVAYPDGCKDLNDVLIAYGPSAVVSLLNEAKPYPVQGLYSFSEFPDVPPLKGLPSGIACMDDKFEIVYGTLTVFTGYANMGKSTVINTIIANMITRGVKTCIASFETMAKPILRDGIAKALIGCSNNDYDRHKDKQSAWDAIEDNVKIISNALNDEMEIDLEDYLDLARTAVMQHGVKFIILDPWNELEHKRNNNETGTEYVGRAIRKIKQFAKRYDVAFWIVAHPTKPQKGVNSMPSLYDISDSANWSNKADYGLVYHRKDKSFNQAELAVVKVRMGLPGMCGLSSVKFDHRDSRIKDSEQ